MKTLGLSLSIPYLVSHGLAPHLVTSPALLVALQRRIYPLLLLLTAFTVFFTMQARQFKKLVEHIKNDRYYKAHVYIGEYFSMRIELTIIGCRYLVGRRLVNYNHVESMEAAAVES